MRRKKVVNEGLTPEEIQLCREVANSPRLLSEVLGVVRSQGEADHRFDVNLAEGKVSEELLRDLLSGKAKIEVKRQYKASETGRVLIEYAHKGGRKLSGITTTEADWYALVLDGKQYNGEVIVLLDTERLRLITRAFGQSNKYSGQAGYSSFKLIPVCDLLATNNEIRLCTPRKRKKSSTTAKPVKIAAQTKGTGRIKGV